MEAYTLTYVNKQPRRVCCETSRLKLKLWNNPEGWEWWEVGGRFKGERTY